MHGDARGTHDDDRRIGERIRAARMRAGISPTELAQQLGISFQQVQKYEKGYNRVSATRLAAISRALAVDFGSLLPFELTKNNGVLRLKDDELELLRLFARIKRDRFRHALLSLARSLAE